MWLFKHSIKIKILRQFIKFCIVGIANTLLDYAVYLFFTRIFGFYFLYANIISTIAGMTSSFIFNKYWTFKNREKDFKKQYLKFVIVNVIYFFLYNGIFYCLVEIFGIYDLIAKIIAVFICIFWNFLANRYWTFRL